MENGKDSGEGHKSLIIVIVMAVILYGVFFWNILEPDKEVSEGERRYLAVFPDWEASDIKTGKFMRDFDSYSMDQFPMREGFRGVKTGFSRFVLMQRDKEGIYYEDGHFSELEKRLDKDSLSYAGDRFSYVYDNYLKGTDCNVYFSIILDKNYFLAEDNGYPGIDYGELISIMREKTDKMQYIDIKDSLSLSDYYRTDPHWRQENIVDTAKKLGEEMGVEIPGNYEDSLNYEMKTLDRVFYGAYSGRWALPVEGERMNFLTNEVMASMKVTLYESNTELGIYDMEKAGGRDPYEMFLSGPQSLITIENPMADNDRELVIFRDSFGSSIAPLLAQGYKKVTLVDIRYLSSAALGYWIDFNSQDVLFLYSTMVLNHSEVLK